MTTPTPTTPPSLAKPAAPRWLAFFATGGAASLAAAGNADAAIVQITQTNLHAGGNFVSGTDTSSFFTDFTGDGIADVLPYRTFPGTRGFTEITNPDAYAQLNFDNHAGSYVVPGPPTPLTVGAQEVSLWAGFDPPGFMPPTPGPPPPTPAPVAAVGKGGPAGDSILASGNPVASAVVLFRIFIRDANLVSDPDYNAGGTYRGHLGLAEALLTSDNTPGGASITISRIVFDDADPDALLLPGNGFGTPYVAPGTTLAASYAEAQAIPEPSRLALLTLGAAGILARRKRKQQAA